MARVYLFLAEGFEEIEALTVVDLLRRGRVDVATVSVSGEKQVTGSHGVTVAADLCLPADPVTGPQGRMLDADMYVLPGGMPGTTHLKENETLAKLLTEAAAEGKTIAAICAAPSVLGALGLLKGRSAVCYPGVEEQLMGAEIVQDPRETVVHCGNIITSRGMGTAIPFGLYLLQVLEGSETAQRIADGIIFRFGSDGRPACFERRAE